MKKIILLVLSFTLITTLVACGNKKTETPPASSTPPPASSQSAAPPASSTPAVPAQSSSASGEPVTVKMADGSEKTAAYTNGFYQFETSSSVKVLELAYLHNNPATDMATLKLLLEGDAQGAIAFLVPKHIAHGDYGAAWENADSILNIEDFNTDGLYGSDGSWQMPSAFWNYEVRVFDDRQSETKTELAFVPLAAETEVEIGELVQLKTASALKVNGLTMDKTEYKVGDNEEITGKLDAEGFGDEAWIGIVPSGVPHGDDDRNDTYDTDYEYLSALENGKITLTIPESAGNYDLRINDGTVEIAYMSIIVK